MMNPPRYNNPQQYQWKKRNNEREIQRRVTQQNRKRKDFNNFVITTQDENRLVKRMRIESRSEMRNFNFNNTSDASSTESVVANTIPVTTTSTEMELTRTLAECDLRIRLRERKRISSDKSQKTAMVPIEAVHVKTLDEIRQEHKRRFGLENNAQKVEEKVVVETNVTEQKEQKPDTLNRRVLNNWNWRRQLTISTVDSSSNKEPINEKRELAKESKTNSTEIADDTNADDDSFMLGGEENLTEIADDTNADDELILLENVVNSYS